METINNIKKKTVFTSVWVKIICNNLNWIAFETDMKGNCVWISDEWEEKTGLSLEQALNHGWRIGIHHEDRDSVFNEWKSAIENQSSFDYAYRLINREGDVTKVKGVGLLVCEESLGDDCYGYVGILKPI